MYCKSYSLREFCCAFLRLFLLQLILEIRNSSFLKHVSTQLLEFDSTLFMRGGLRVFVFCRGHGIRFPPFQDQQRLLAILRPAGYVVNDTNIYKPFIVAVDCGSSWKLGLG